MEAGGAAVEALGGLGVDRLGCDIACRAAAPHAGAAIDEIAHDPFGVEGAAHGVGLEANADQVVRVKAVESLCDANAHLFILPFLYVQPEWCVPKWSSSARIVSSRRALSTALAMSQTPRRWT